MTKENKSNDEIALELLQMSKEIEESRLQSTIRYIDKCHEITKTHIKLTLLLLILGSILLGSVILSVISMFGV